MKFRIFVAAAWLAGTGLAGTGLAGMAPAAAADGPAPAVAKLLACDFVDGSKARLKCFEAALGAVRAAYPEAAAMAVAEREEIARLTAQQKEADFGLALGESGLNSFAAATETPVEERAAEGPVEAGENPARPAEEEISRIESTVVTAGRNKEGRIVVTLENGQIWRQRQSDSTPLVIGGKGAGEAVSIRRGALGGYFVKIGKTPAFRAERVK